MVKRGGERRVDDDFSRSFEFRFPRSRQFGPGSFRLRGSENGAVAHMPSMGDGGRGRSRTRTSK